MQCKIAQYLYTYIKCRYLAMGVDVYQTNQTSRTTFRASQITVPVKVPSLSRLLPPLRLSAAPQLMQCRPLDHVPPLD